MPTLGLASVTSSSVHTAADPSLGGSLVKMILALAVLGACAVALRRRAQGRSVRPARGLARRDRFAPQHYGLRVITRQTLGKGAYLAVVQWGEREVLCGVTAAGISFYKENEIGDEETPSSPTGEPAVALAPAAMRTPVPNRTPTFGAPSPPRPSLLETLRDLTTRR